MKFKPISKTVVTEFRSYIVDAVSKVGNFRQSVSAKIPDDIPLSNLDFSVSTTNHLDLHSATSIFAVHSPEPIKLVLMGSGPVEPPVDDSSNSVEYHTGELTLPSSIIAGRPLPVGLVDLDLVQAVASINVVAYNEVTGETETVTLNRTVDGNYAGSLVTLNDAFVGDNFDGRMNISYGQSLRIIYSDPTTENNIRESIEGSVSVLSPYTTAEIETRDTISIAKPIPIIIRDKDVTTSTVLVVVRNLTTGERDNITLPKDEDGVYKGSLSTGIYDGSSFTDYDGVIQVALGHRIEILYTDNFDINGQTTVVTSTLDVALAGSDSGTLEVATTVDMDTELTITVHDYDVIGQQLGVTVTNLATSEFEVVACEETVFGSGKFIGSISIASLGTGDNLDGVLVVAEGDQLRLAYVDALTSTGDQSILVESFVEVIDSTVDVPQPTEPTPDPQPTPDPVDNTNGTGTVEFLVDGAFFLNGSFNGSIRIEGLNEEPTRCTLLHV